MNVSQAGNMSSESIFIDSDYEIEPKKDTDQVICWALSKLNISDRVDLLKSDFLRLEEFALKSQIQCLIEFIHKWFCIKS